MLIWIGLGCLLYLFFAIVLGCCLKQSSRRANYQPGYDGWTGDDALDLISLVAWPVTLVIIMALLVGTTLRSALFDH